MPSIDLCVRWEITGTNFFNTPSYNNPGVNITSVAAGGEQDLDAGGPRGFRTGLRIEF